MVNKLAVELGVVVGLSVTVTCFQVVWDPEMADVVEARIVPDVVCKPTTRFPLNFEAVGNLKKKEAVYVDPAVTWIPAALLNAWYASRV